MKPALKRLYDYFIIDRTHRALRVPCEVDFAALFSKEDLCDEERMCRRFETVMAMETPRILPDEQIVLTRSVSTFGDVYTEEERETRSVVVVEFSNFADEAFIFLVASYSNECCFTFVWNLEVEEVIFCCKFSK